MKSLGRYVLWILSASAFAGFMLASLPFAVGVLLGMVLWNFQPRLSEALDRDLSSLDKTVEDMTT